MEQLELTFRAENQVLEATNFTPPLLVASNTVAWIKAHFDLGANWDCWNLGAVKAMWKFNKGEVYSAVLDVDGNCIIPHEVLGEKTGEVKVNLVASEIENDLVVERITSYPLYCINVNKVARVEGDNSVAITPSEYEQFVEDVQTYAQTAVDAMNDAETAQGKAETAQEKAEIAQIKAEDAQLSAEIAQGKAEDAQEGAETAESNAQAQALKSEGFAVGEQNGTPVTSGSPYYHNNAEYYKDLAEQAEQGILDLTATASVDATVGTPSVVVTVTEGETKNMDFAFHNLKGEKGNVNFASFEINPTTGILTMFTDEEYSGADFFIDSNGYMIVEV